VVRRCGQLSRYGGGRGEIGCSDAIARCVVVAAVGHHAEAFGQDFKGWCAANKMSRSLLPLIGGIGMTVAFIISARDMLDPEYGFTAFGPIGGVFVIGIGMLALGVPLMIACAVRFRAFFRGETLNEDIPILVPDTGEEPAALHE
jgi:hypothetical protein